MSVTRRQLVAAAVGAAAVRAGPAGAQSTGAGGLERLLALEHRLEAAYRAALDRGVIDPALGHSLSGQERDHVRGVEVALETLGRRAQRPRVVPPGRAALADRPAFARFALELETEAVAGYVEVLARLDAPGLLQPLGSIMTSGAQHQVALRRVLAEPLLARGG
jgi:hypothetical protein